MKTQVLKNISFIIGLLLFGLKLHSQCPFNAPDTVCVNQKFQITFSPGGPCGVEGTDVLEWDFESSRLSDPPSVDTIQSAPFNNMAYLASAKDEFNNIYAFATRHKSTPALIRYNFGSTLLSNPSGEIIVRFDTLGVSVVEGIKIAQDKGRWVMFISAGITPGYLFRLFFDNGLNNPPTSIERLDHIKSKLNFPHDIELVNHNNHWYGFVSNQRECNITVIDFMNGLDSDTSNIKATTIPFDKISQEGAIGLATAKDEGRWFLFAVHTSFSNSVFRFDFDDAMVDYNNSMMNVHYTFNSIPVATSKMKSPRDISIVNDCNRITGMVMNTGESSFTILSFDSTLSGSVVAEKHFITNTDLMPNPHGQSEVYTFGAAKYTLVINNRGATTSPITRVKFQNTSGISHTIPLVLNKTTFHPEEYSYTDTGFYNVSVTLNGEVSKTYCKTIYVRNPPPKPLAIDPDWVCAGQRITAIPAYGVSANRSRYLWTYPDNSEKKERSPVVGTTGTYIVRNAYDQCLGDTIQRRITVSDRPKAPGVVSPYYSCPENWPTNFLTATNLKPNDRIFWYADKDLLSLKKSDTVASTYSTFIPRDSLVGTYSYYVSRKPEKKDCPREISDSVLVRMVLQRPSPPTVKKDTAFCLSDKSYEPLYATGQKVRWYLTPTLDSMTAEGSTWKPLFSKGGIYKIYATYDSAGTGCRSHPGYATLTVKETPQPLMDMNPIEGCEGFFITPEFKATTISGGSISYYFDSLASNPTGPPSLKYKHDKKTEGTYNFWVVQLANGCTSIPEKLTVDITKTNPPQIQAPNDHYYSCYNIGYAALHLVPDSGYTKIQWYLQNGQKADGDTVFYPSNAINKGTYLYTAEQEVNGCKSYKRDSVILEILECTDTLVYYCNTMDSVNLFDIHNPALHQYKWQDNDNTQALTDSVVDLQTTSLHSKTREFQYYNRLVKMRVDKQRYAGLPKDTIIEGYCYQSFIPTLQNRDEGGKWYLNQTEVKPNPDLLLISGSNEVKYMIPITYACVEDVSKMTILADSLSPVITCPKAIYKTLEVGESGYIVMGNELDPITIDDRNCDAYTLVNDYNQKATLDSAYFSIEEKSMMNYPITWLVTDNFGMTATCMTDITIATFRIPNLFTPNGDGENDTWMFQLDDQSTATVRVYNRWGVLVWDSKGSLFINWDGNDAGGKQLPSDGYMYIVSENNKTILKGTVTMMR